MGYQAGFEFDLVIPAEHVEAAEKAMIEVLKRDLTRCTKRTFCQAFNEAWGEGLAEEATPTPLVALASGCVRGEITISGYCHKSWREWEEPMLDAIAPFVQKGGCVTVKGEDYDAPSEWRFDGRCRYTEDYENILTSERKELEAKAKRLEKAESLLRRLTTFGIPDDQVWNDVRDYLKPKAPLEQLAETAE